MSRIIVATACKISAIRRPGQATDLLRVSSNSSQLDYPSMNFMRVLLGIGIGPFDGIIMKIPNIIANQQIFACYVKTSEKGGQPEADGWFEGKARDWAQLLHLKSGSSFL
jgi:hypothetical protein